MTGNPSGSYEFDSVEHRRGESGEQFLDDRVTGDRVVGDMIELDQLEGSLAEGLAHAVPRAEQEEDQEPEQQRAHEEAPLRALALARLVVVGLGATGAAGLVGQKVLAVPDGVEPAGPAPF